MKWDDRIFPMTESEFVENYSAYPIPAENKMEHIVIPPTPIDDLLAIQKELRERNKKAHRRHRHYELVKALASNPNYFRPGLAVEVAEAAAGELVADASVILNTLEFAERLGNAASKDAEKIPKESLPKSE